MTKRIFWDIWVDENLNFLTDEELEEILNSSWWWDTTMWESFVTNVTIWSIQAGTTINSTDQLKTLIKNMLVTYIAPAVSCSITPSTVLYKKWETVNLTKLSASVTKNSKPITKVTFKAWWTVLEELTTWIENGWTFNCSQTINQITSDTTYSVEVTDWQETKIASKKIEFVVPFYYWASQGTTVNTVTWLTEDLSKKSNKNYTYNLNNEYITIVYDNSYWLLNNIKDISWFDLIEWYDTWTFEENWNTYRYYVSQLANTDTNAKFNFNF